MRILFFETVRVVGFELITSVFRFPFWWYTTGLSQLVRNALRSLTIRSREYGFAIWVKNFFVPMYGQTDLVGRLVSLWMRSLVLAGRASAFTAEFLLWAIGILLWILAPIISAIFVILNLVARKSLFI